MIIIGILAAIAIPVFLSQRKKAQDAAAKADVSTIGKEIATYYVDGTAPPGAMASRSAPVATCSTSRVSRPSEPAIANQDLGKASANNVLGAADLHRWHRMVRLCSPTPRVTSRHRRTSTPPRAGSTPASASR